VTHWGRRIGGLSSKNNIFSRTLSAGAGIASATSTYLGHLGRDLLQRTSTNALLVRSLPVTVIAATGGLVFTLGVAAAVAPSTSDSTPRLAEASATVIGSTDITPVVSAIQDPTAPAAQAALLSLSADDTLTTASVELAPQKTASGLRGSLAVAKDPVSDINESFAAEQSGKQVAVAEPLGPPTPVRQSVAYTIESGDTIGRVLKDMGITPEDARAAVNALADHFSPRDLKIGQKLDVELETLPVKVAALGDGDLETPAPALVSFNLKADIERSLRVTYNAETSTFESQEIFRELTKRVVRAEGQIEGSLFGAAAKVGVPNAVMVEFVKLYSYSVDFQREIRKGDSFEIYYTEFADDDGERVKSGDILFASLQTGKKPMSLWRFEIPGEDTVDYFDENGQSSKKFLMRTPVDGARISSSFGMRRHPILGYSKMHTGTDFAAPTGTPIYAAGNGTVVKAGWNGGYGKYVKIRHANGYATAYAHLSRIGKGITPGARVKQGQTIGRVGSTGRSTGPHLHYEVHVKGKKVNPMTIRVPTGRKLEGKALTAFKAARDGMTADMAKTEPLKPEITAAAADTSDSANSVE